MSRFDIICNIIYALILFDVIYFSFLLADYMVKKAEQCERRIKRNIRNNRMGRN